MRVRNIILVLAIGLLIPLCAPAQNVVNLKAVMIYASNKPAPIDERLENIEFKLRKIFKFEHYLHYGEGSTALTLPGSGTITLGKGYALNVEASRSSGGKIRAKVTWRRGDQVLLRATQQVGRRTPTVMGGASHNEGTLIVTLVIP
jgi:hypothetical protein